MANEKEDYSLEDYIEDCKKLEEECSHTYSVAAGYKTCNKCGKGN